MLHLQPQNGIWFVAQDGVTRLEPPQILSEAVGGKAFGLTTIPQVWTLPFLVIASDIFETAKYKKGDPGAALTEKFQKSVFNAAHTLGIDPDELVLLRSSATIESVEERGKFLSDAGPLKNIAEIIRNCCARLVNDPEAKQSRINFIVQKQANPIHLRGHLSNERRLAKEARDWFYEFEDVTGRQGDVERIAIRRWREGDPSSPSPMFCQYSVSIAEALRLPARWATARGVRVHFEWVWDGERLYIVQADPVLPTRGTNPTKLVTGLKAPVSKLNLRIFRPITSRDADKFDKVRNVFTYRSLKLPTAPLFILDDVQTLDKLAQGSVSEELLSDLSTLTTRPLVLRTDINSDKTEVKEMLPRSEGLHSVKDVKKFLTTTLKLLVDSGHRVSELAVLAHHFIPAVASAWSYAEPGTRKVLIEALWGIPEGMYYFSHDTFEVDTLRIDPKKIRTPDKAKFPVSSRCRYKRHFVTSTTSGEWKTQQLPQPFDWKCSIRQSSWIRQIAYQSRILAHHDGHPLNIMWFVDLPKITGLPKVLPWFHTRPTQKLQLRRGTARKKFVTDRDHYIETADDIKALAAMGPESQNYVRRIRIRPKDASLLRNKEFATEIGELANKLHAVVVLEGGMLSHTYYVLCRTGAQVETVDDFVGDDDVREYNKLVRDYIPKQIATYGERVRVTRLKGDRIINALRTKLVEEAIETLDAGGTESLTEELADVSEVISSLLKRLRLKRTDLEGRQRKKRRSKGGFNEGYVLLKTRNPPIVEDDEKDAIMDLLEKRGEHEPDIVEVKSVQLVSEILQRSVDKRRQGESIESILTLEIPLLTANWETATGEFSIADAKGTPFKLHCRLIGKRLGSVLRLELSVIIPSQLPLDFEGISHGQR